jgi:hypothetical protein
LQLIPFLGRLNNLRCTSWQQQRGKKSTCDSETQWRLWQLWPVSLFYFTSFPSFFYWDGLCSLGQKMPDSLFLFHFSLLGLVTCVVPAHGKLPSSFKNRKGDKAAHHFAFTGTISTLLQSPSNHDMIAWVTEFLPWWSCNLLLSLLTLPHIPG